MTEEIWKDVPNYEGYCQVSNLGRVKSLARVVVKSNGRNNSVRERIMMLSNDNFGYFKTKRIMNISKYKDGSVTVYTIRTFYGKEIIQVKRGDSIIKMIIRGFAVWLLIMVTFALMLVASTLNS